jgi:catechol 2,3-dioxygenase-like lactoylglutathione lyase family enzyme
MPATVSSAGVFDHVAIAVADLAASERFYRTVISVLGVEPSYADAELVEWDDWDIGATDREHPVTRGLHVGFRAPSREAVDAFWQAGIDAGYRDDGAPGPRTIYGPGDAWTPFALRTLRGSHTLSTVRSILTGSSGSSAARQRASAGP